jgi:hypothetical protein
MSTDTTFIIAIAKIHIIYTYIMRQAVIVLCLLGLLGEAVLSKALVANKVILAINCGSKDETVDSHDKTFKYQPVTIL